MKAKSSAAQPIYIPVLRDSVSGKQVEVPKDAKGQPDFFVAATRLRKLQDQTVPKVSAPTVNPKEAAAKKTFLKAKAEYFKDVKNHNQALDKYEKKKAEIEQAKSSKAKPAKVAQCEKAEAKAKQEFGKANVAVFASEKRYEQARKDYEKELKVSKKQGAYDYSSHIGSAFGKKFPGHFGTPQLVWVAKSETPKPIVSAKPKVAVKIPPKPAPKPAITTTMPKPVKAAIPPAPTPVAKMAAPTSPGSDKYHPIDYTSAELKDGIISIYAKNGETLKFARKDIQYQSLGNGLSSIKTSDGKILWFRCITPEEKPKSTPVAQKETAPSPPAAASDTVKFSGVSDAEAASYSAAVPGYPCAKVPAHVWKHKSDNKFLAVFDGKRVLLNEAQFLSLDKGAHPELYAKAGPSASPDF